MSASEHDLEHDLDRLDARDPVEATTSGDDVERTKKAADIIATALARLVLLNADEMMVVRDTPCDVKATGKCRCAAITLGPGGFADKVLRTAGAVARDDIVDDLLRSYKNALL